MDNIDYSSPFRVRITADCRDHPSKNLGGKYGFCLGLYEYPDITKKIPEGASREGLDYNPLILTEDGEYIWGVQCYWTEDPIIMDFPLDVLQEATALQAYLFRMAASARGN